MLFQLPATVLPEKERKFEKISVQQRFFNSKGIVYTGSAAAADLQDLLGITTSYNIGSVICRQSPSNYGPICLLVNPALHIT